MMNYAAVEAHLGTLVDPPDIDSDPKVIEAEQYVKTVEALHDVEYNWTFDYAKDAYNRVAATRDLLDAKAGEIIKYLGGGAGFITLAAILNVTPAKTHILLWALPSFVMTIVALFFAVLARMPNSSILPPSPKDAKAYADHFTGEREAKAAFVGQWHRSYQIARVTNAHMADRVQTSIIFFLLAVAMLIAPLIAAVC
jgi:hypothetical protein